MPGLETAEEWNQAYWSSKITRLQNWLLEQCHLRTTEKQSLLSSGVFIVVGVNVVWFGKEKIGYKNTLGLFLFHKMKGHTLNCGIVPYCVTAILLINKSQKNKFL